MPAVPHNWRYDEGHWQHQRCRLPLGIAKALTKRKTPTYTWRLSGGLKYFGHVWACTAICYQVWQCHGDAIQAHCSAKQCQYSPWPLYHDNGELTNRCGSFCFHLRWVSQEQAAFPNVSTCDTLSSSISANSHMVPVLNVLRSCIGWR